MMAFRPDVKTPQHSPEPRARIEERVKRPIGAAFRMEIR
jgi:hypothetical protein